jgi:tetratricopeptide (TPR) repeat protein
MSDISVARRFVLATLAIAVAGALTRSQIADALVLRGDECLYRAEPARGLTYYRRALWIDARNGTAVDRFVFVATLLRDGLALREGTQLASIYLEKNPSDEVVRLDRAMAYRALHRSNDALGDFALVGIRHSDPRALTFAGYEAQVLGESSRARVFWLEALRIDPDFVPARRALARDRSDR